MIRLVHSRLSLFAFVLLTTQFFILRPINGAETEQKLASPLAQTYSLLYATAHRDSMVTLIFMVKTASPDATTLVKSIAQLNGRIAHEVEEYADGSRIDLDRNPLPPAEIEVRKRISNMKEHDLMSQSGAKFTLQLLLTQFDALGYERQLCAQVADLETSSTRRDYFSQASRHLEQLQSRVVALIAAGG